MEIRILGWRSNGMKCPDVDLKFDREDLVDFIQMRNGAGKTTTLTLIKIALTGNPDLEQLKSVRANKGDNKRALFQLLRKDKDIGTFSLDCSINDKLYTFKFVIDRDNKEAIKFSTLSPEYGGQGRSDYAPPQEAIPFLTPEFVELFVFDGEKAGVIFDAKDTRAEETISTLCQFNILEESIKGAENYLKSKSEKIGKGDQGKLTQYKNQIRAYEKMLEEQNQSLKDHRKELENFQSERDEKASRLEKIRGKGNLNYKKDISDVNNEIKVNEVDREKTRKKIMQCIINPAELSSFTLNCSLALNSSLDTLKLPDNVAKAFFDELSDSEECVCGTSIGKKERDHILSNKEKYLDDDLTGLLNKIKSSITEYKGLKNFKLREHIEHLRVLDADAGKLAVKLIRIQKNADENVEEAIKLKSRVDELDNNIEEQKQYIQLHIKKPEPDDYDTKSGEIYNIKVLEDTIEKLKDKYHEYNKSIKLKSSFDTLKKILNETRDESSKTILAGMQIKVQEKIDEVLAEAEPPIEIEFIREYVKLKDQDGLSAGQLLSSAYCFMAAAFEYSSVTVPFIVDSPTGKIDDEIRETVGKMLPFVTKQFVTFITPVERYHFYPHIRISANNRCSYVTIYNRRKKTDEWYENFQREHPDKIDNRNIVNDRYGIIYGHEAMNTFTTAQDPEEYEIEK